MKPSTSCRNTAIAEPTPDFESDTPDSENLDLTPILAQLLRWSRAAWITIRAVEGAAVGALVGTAAALVVVLVQWWTGQPSVSMAIALCGIGAACGALASFLRIPSQSAVAQRIDRQFQLHDLLSSAMAISRDVNADRGMRSVVLAQAEATAARLPRSGIAFARLSGRTHAAAVLAVAMVVTLSAMASPQVAPNQSQRTQPTASRAADMDRGLRTSPQPPAARPRVGTQPIDASLESSRSVNETTPRAARPRTDGGSNRLPQQTLDSGATGAASSTREESTAAVRLPVIDANRPTSEQGTSGSGGVSGEPGDVDGDGAVTSRLPHREPSKLNAPPANEALHQTNPAVDIPPAYREMVRKFFARD